MASVSVRWGLSTSMPRSAALTARPRTRHWPVEVRRTAPGLSRRWERPSRWAAAMAWEICWASW